MRCPKAPAFCGEVERPLDPSGATPGRIAIHFEFYPHTAPGKSIGTLVATEGGPGYPATESRADYLDLFAPLRARRDVVLMDNRGTGQSGAIDCHALQTGATWTVPSIAACGESLGARAPLYSTAYAADDLAALLAALGAHPIDLYGDSYGTYFEQVFAVRHRDMLRSIILDGAYPLDGPDYAWYPTYAPAMRDKFNIACARSAPCAALPGSSLEHIAPTLAQLRAAPFDARARDADGAERSFTANATQLATVMFAGAPAHATVRELDAAARAFMHNDRLPLLRLMAEAASAVDSRDPTDNPSMWSAGLAAAVMCEDPPQIYDMRLPPAERAAERDRVIAARERTAPDTYAPFTIAEYRAMPLDYSFLDECVGWPVAPAAHPAAHVVPADAMYPDIPALVISGELDNITTLADGAAVAAKFKRGRQVRMANSFHVNAVPRARSGCGAEIARRFVATLAPGDTSCAAQIPPVRLVARLATRAAELEPAAGSTGNSADSLPLRYAAAAVLTAGDVLARLEANTSGRGTGLRGGTFRVLSRPHARRVILDGVRFTEDLAVSGTIDEPAARDGTVRAHLRLAGPDGLAQPDGPTGRLEVRWPKGGADSRAKIHGVIDGATVAAWMAAP